MPKPETGLEPATSALQKPHSTNWVILADGHDRIWTDVLAPWQGGMLTATLRAHVYVLCLSGSNGEPYHFSTRHQVNSLDKEFPHFYWPTIFCQSRGFHHLFFVQRIQI